jgi:hypothetical protein
MSLVAAKCYDFLRSSFSFYYSDVKVSGRFITSSSSGYPKYLPADTFLLTIFILRRAYPKVLLPSLASSSMHRVVLYLICFLSTLLTMEISSVFFLPSF